MHEPEEGYIELVGELVPRARLLKNSWRDQVSLQLHCTTK